METLKLNTKKSLYPAIPIEIDGKLYESRKFTRALSLEIEPMQKILESTVEVKEEDEAKVEEEKWDAYCGWMLKVFGVEKVIVEILEVSEVEDIYMKVKVELLRRQKKRMKSNVDAIKAEVDDKPDETQDLQAVSTEEFHFLPDDPVELDEFGTHKRVAQNIAEQILQ